jgi:hypothetical protein
MDAADDVDLDAVLARLDALRGDDERLSTALDRLDVRHWMEGNAHAGGVTVVLDDVGLRTLRMLAEEWVDRGRAG